MADRLDISAGRWGLDGAEAVLTLSILVANGTFPDYWRYHLEQEPHRVHHARHQDEYNLTA
ncbi:hypothetical protein BS35_008645 [Actinomadura glauciflava]|nr:hypothetical protein [Actinomadura glauciflava]